MLLLSLPLLSLSKKKRKSIQMQMLHTVQIIVVLFHFISSICLGICATLNQQHTSQYLIVDFLFSSSFFDQNKNDKFKKTKTSFSLFLSFSFSSFFWREGGGFPLFSLSVTQICVIVFSCYCFTDVFFFLLWFLVFCC